MTLSGWAWKGIWRLSRIKSDVKEGLRSIMRRGDDDHCLTRSQIDLLPRRRRIWVIARDASQLHIALAFMDELRSRRPETAFLLSVENSSSRDQATLKAGIDDIVSLIPRSSRKTRFLLRLARPPCLAVIGGIAEASLLCESSLHGIPTAWIGADMPEIDYETWKRSKRPWKIRAFVESVDLICASAEEERVRLIDIGFHPGKIHVTGSIKFGVPGSTLEEKEIAEAILRRAGIERGTPILMGGSIWKGEEDPLLDAFAALKRRHPSLVLILAPRLRRDGAEIVRKSEASGWITRLRSTLNPIGQPEKIPSDVLVIDSHGELKDLYAFATVVFVGRSLTYYTGSNPIEPAAHGKPILTGPNALHFSDLVEEFVKADAILRIHDADELMPTIDRLLLDAGLRERLGSAARSVVDSKANVMRETIERMERSGILDRLED